MNYKTVRELAREFNISKEAIYKKINYSMKNELENHIVIHNKTTYITKKGEDIIFNSLKKEIRENIVKNNDEIEVSNQVNNDLNYVIMLESKLAHLIKENDRLTKINIKLNNKIKLKTKTKFKAKKFNTNKIFNFRFIKNIFYNKALKY